MKEIIVGFIEKPNINRGLFYGENLFTSFSSFELLLPFLELHTRRLELGLKVFYPELEVRQLIEEAFSEVCSLQGESHTDLYFRLTPLISLCKKQAAIQINYREKDHEIVVEKNAVTKKMNWFFTKLNKKTKLGNYHEEFLLLGEINSGGKNDFVKVDLDNNILEASTSNLFFVKNGEVIIPDSRNDILSGIIIKNIEGIRREVKLDELDSFDECFFTNSVDYIVPVMSINDKKLSVAENKSKKDLMIKYLPKIFEVECES